ncbi:hypothetical protein Y981_08265 [Leptospirillum ferriphilum YSK]|uniref:Uncharacterized protein n=1 Tax=Leptospirillum ferriphilum YSK TaxID=1441628 RepID=A0A059XY59_9BACT|nr:hypothetical protein Y981_08265 [Leptospirillum ferriphilum YSK]
MGLWARNEERKFLFGWSIMIENPHPDALLKLHSLARTLPWVPCSSGADPNFPPIFRNDPPEHARSGQFLIAFLDSTPLHP